MEDHPTRVLLVEDHHGYAGLVRKILTDTPSAQFDLVHVEWLSTALERLGEQSFDVALVDLSLPDATGLDTVTRIQAQAPGLPIVVLTATDDEGVAVKAVQAGAQDYLSKDHVDGNLLVRSIRYAIERQRLQGVLHRLSFLDELTGLYNRRGFFSLAEQQLRLAANRTKRALCLVYADLNGLKQINDTFGHQEGDRALITTAEILRRTFRTTDVIARMGGDEFAVIAIEASTDESFTARLHQSLDADNTKGGRPYPLSLSVGIARYDPASPTSIDELLSRADAAMYESKKAQHES